MTQTDSNRIHQFEIKIRVRSHFNISFPVSMNKSSNGEVSLADDDSRLLESQNDSLIDGKYS